MTLTGSLGEVENCVYLTTPEETHFRVQGQLPDKDSSARGIKQWSVLPSIGSDGRISSVQVMGVAEQSKLLADYCELIGRVIQLGKRNATVLLKVERPGQKTLKLTLLNPPEPMKIGQLWYVLAFLKSNYLYIERAEDIDANLNPSGVLCQQQESSPNTTALPNGAVKRIVHSELNDGSELSRSETFDQTKARLTPRAKKALSSATGMSGWVLTTPVRRGLLWEWEATRTTNNGQLGQSLRARVQVNPTTEQAKVYQYHQLRADPTKSPTVSEVNDLDGGTVWDFDANPLTDRLIVTPLGAARSIGSSCFQVLIGPYEVVLDAGTRPKGNNPLPAFEYLKNPNLILITHAHQDHIGALPVLHRMFPATPLVATPGTREIASVMLKDCLKIKQSNEDFPELFDETDLNQTIFHLETQPVGVDFEPLPGLKVRFIHAGHIIGAACIYLRYGERTLLYTGDYNTASSRTTEGLKLADLPEADMLITESTYGADTHPVRKTQETALMNAIASVVQAGGNVLIPAFALGRAQEILLALRTSALFQKFTAPIYVDGLVRAVTDTFREHLELLPDSVQNLVKQSGTEPFYDEKSKPTVIPITHPLSRPLAMAQPSVIIASSGMLNGGPSVYYAKALLERENAAIFISGYTDEESPGRLLQNLQTGDTIELDGLELTVRAQIKRFHLSAHADKVGLTQVIGRVNPRHLILIHGCHNAPHSLAQSGDLRSKHFIHIPSVGEKIESGVAPDYMDAKQLARLAAPQEFEIEVSDEIEGAWIRIPESVVESDPRWRMLTRNGVILAKWEGLALKLLPATKQKSVIEKAHASGEDCCARCQHFDAQNSQCQCHLSPLSGLMVDPSGCCLEYAASLA